MAKKTTSKRRGRPPGSKNKVKKKVTKKVAKKATGKKRGRPPGSKNKVAKKRTTKKVAKKATGKRRGRPPGSKNKATTTAKKRGRPAGSNNRATASYSSASTGRLGTISTQALHDEIARRSSTLLDRRDALVAELDMVESEIAALGGASQPTRRGVARKATKRVSKGAARSTTNKQRGRRKGGKGTLESSLVKQLTGRTMGVAEVASAVKKAGYKSKSSNFRTIVNQCLTKSNRFKKVSRGKYTAA